MYLYILFQNICTYKVHLIKTEMKNVKSAPIILYRIRGFYFAERMGETDKTINEIKQEQRWQQEFNRDIEAQIADNSTRISDIQSSIISCMIHLFQL